MDYSKEPICDVSVLLECLNISEDSVSKLNFLCRELMKCLLSLDFNNKDDCGKVLSHLKTFYSFSSFAYHNNVVIDEKILRDVLNYLFRVILSDNMIKLDCVRDLLNYCFKLLNREHQVELLKLFGKTLLVEKEVSLNSTCPEQLYSLEVVKILIQVGESVNILDEFDLSLILESFGVIIADWICTHDIKLSAKVINLCFHDLLNCSMKYRIIEILLNKVASVEKSIKDELILLIFSSLSCFIFDGSLAKITQIIESNDFWNSIHFGLLSGNIVHRKQALYVLKQVVNFVSQNQINVNCKYFNWSVDKSFEYSEMWDKMFILFETLEEKQVHIVVSALSSVRKLSQIWCVKSEMLDFSWICLIMKMTFSHDSLSVVKWGLDNYLMLPVEMYVPDDNFKLVLPLLLGSMNDMSLFTRTIDCITRPCATEATLQSWFQQWSNREGGKVFFNQLILEMTAIPWSPIPLFHIALALSRIDACPSWGSAELVSFKKILTVSLNNHSVFIRGAIQNCLLDCLHKLIDKGPSFVEVADIFSCFSRDECLKRGTKSWAKCLQLISHMEPNIKDFFSHCKERINDVSFIPVIARTLIMLSDSKLYSEEIIEFLDESFECFKFYDKRVYSDPTEIEKRSLLIHYLSLDSLYLNSGPSLDDCLIRMFTLPLREIRSCLSMNRGITSLESLELYASFLNGIVSDKSLAVQGFDFLSQSFNDCCKIVSKGSLSLELYLALSSIKFLLSVKSNFIGMISSGEEESMKSLILGGIINSSIVPIHVSDPTNLSKRDLRKLESKVIQSAWEVLGLSIDLFGDGFLEVVISLIPCDQIICQGLAAIDTGGSSAVVHVLKVLRKVFPLCEDKPLFERAVSSTWEATLALRKTEAFWDSAENWIQALYQESIISSDVHSEVSLEFSEKVLLMSQDVTGLLSIFVKQLQKECLNVDLSPYLDVICEALIFGLVPRKDDRIELETINYIRSFGDEISINVLKSNDQMRSNMEARIRSLDIVIESFKLENSDSFISTLILKLLDKDVKLFSKHPRYFNDSYQHRVKHRLLLVLHVVIALIHEKETTALRKLELEVLKWAEATLFRTCHQASVRYLLEWLLIRININNFEVRKQFWQSFNKTKTGRIGSVCSFISIAYHIAKVYYDEEFFEACLENILPWCMSQNFSARLYAQITLQSLWPIYSSISKKYDIIWKNIDVIYDQGNSMINAHKLQNDFYFETFHPINHFTQQALFWDLPRLSKITYNEWVPASMLDFCLTNKLSCTLSDSNSDALAKCVSPSWEVKASEMGEEEVDISSIQKKYLPIDSEIGLKSQANKMKAKKGDLVVVASLIDKIPNLGGLARTCDVMAVSQLVLPSIEMVSDKQFLSLSMSAEIHLNMSEVKPFNLGVYLSGMKKLGYTIVGAEQTADSVSLETFPFPKKCLLILGSEKEGIPANLLPALDVCVEVPQYGLIRSLNVHVTGALFIWEYTKQHITNRDQPAL